MSFLFATSHLPAVKRPQIEEEEEDNAQPMQRSGGVRAISHLEEPRRGGAAVPLSQRGAQPLGRLVQTEKPTGPSAPPADGVAAAKASGIFDVVRHQYNLGGNEHFMDEDGQLRPRNESRSLASPSPAGKRPFWADEPEVHADHDPDCGFDDIHPEELAPGTHDAEFGASSRDTHINSPDTKFQRVADKTSAQQASSNIPARIANGAAQSPPSAPSTPTANLIPPWLQKPAQVESPDLVMNAADAQQNTATRPESGNTRKIPGDLEYALKFIGGTLIDAPLNTAVAVFGGPGKYSYEPSPVRRALGVDGALPKIDRHLYNQWQDGAEMLAFSFAGALNPKNRVQVAVPAPAARNADGTPLDPKIASQWLKEYRANVQKTGSGEFQIGVNENNLKSRLVNGTVNFDISRTIGDGTMHGSDMFKAMMEFYGPSVKAIQGNWVSGVNLDKVNLMTGDKQIPLERAVKMTWTGLQAAAHGYTEVEINHCAGENGKFTDIQVTFRKPGS